MAKGKRKRANEAKLKVIAGGAAPKAVVTKRAPASSSPAADARPKVGLPNLRREVEAKRAVEAENDESIDTRESAVAEVARERKSPFPRAIILGGLVVALGGAAWAITRNSTEPKAVTPTAVTSAPPIESAPPAASVTVAPSPVPTVTEPSVAAASVSAPASASVSASAPAPIASTSAPAAPSVTAPVVAPKPPPPPPPAPKPKPADENPYQ